MYLKIDLFPSRDIQNIHAIFQIISGLIVVIQNTCFCLELRKNQGRKFARLWTGIKTYYLAICQRSIISILASDLSGNTAYRKTCVPSVTIPMGVPFFFLILAFTGQLQSILGFSWQSYVWLSLAGIIHLVLGRSFAYKCVQLVGANIAGILRRVEIFITVIIGISLLHEPLSWQLAIGVVLIIIGIVIVVIGSIILV
ncbi:EamA family transporter [Thermodesulfobacteriota bacterium]